MSARYSSPLLAVTLAVLNDNECMFQEDEYGTGCGRDNAPEMSARYSSPLLAVTSAVLNEHFAVVFSFLAKWWNMASIRQRPLPSE
jgi:hypothetical protein